MMKRKLYIAVRQAAYFLRWERPLYASYFDLVDQPSANAITLAFGPDVLEHAAKVPAKRRAAMLFPGFGCNPYHNLAYREKALATLRASYDLALANPGPLEVAYREFERL